MNWKAFTFWKVFFLYLLNPDFFPPQQLLNKQKHFLISFYFKPSLYDVWFSKSSKNRFFFAIYFIMKFSFLLCNIEFVFLKYSKSCELSTWKRNVFFLKIFLLWILEIERCSVYCTKKIVSEIPLLKKFCCFLPFYSIYLFFYYLKVELYINLL